MTREAYIQINSKYLKVNSGNFIVEVLNRLPTDTLITEVIVHSLLDPVYKVHSESFKEVPLGCIIPHIKMTAVQNSDGSYCINSFDMNNVLENKIIGTTIAVNPFWNFPPPTFLAPFNSTSSFDALANKAFGIDPAFGVSSPKLHHFCTFDEEYIGFNVTSYYCKCGKKKK